jgi:hypothetical protein
MLREPDAAPSLPAGLPDVESRVSGGVQVQTGNHRASHAALLS